MKLVDANVLLYAVNEDAPRHSESRRWLDGALSGEATVAFAWIALLAFLRLSTKRNLFANPLSPTEAVGRAEAWLARPSATLVEPTARHLWLVQELLEPLGAGGNLVNDAHLAALAVEHHCQIVSYDRDFTRFAGVTLETPA